VIWRRVAEVLRLRGALRLMDERAEHRQKLLQLAEEQRTQTVATAEMSRQSRIGSYGRVRLR
jgi:hypothetical protein